MAVTPHFAEYADSRHVTAGVKQRPETDGLEINLRAKREPVPGRKHVRLPIKIRYG